MPKRVIVRKKRKKIEEPSILESDFYIKLYKIIFIVMLGLIVFFCISPTKDTKYHLSHPKTTYPTLNSIQDIPYTGKATDEKTGYIYDTKSENSGAKLNLKPVLNKKGHMIKDSKWEKNHKNEQSS